MADYEDIIGETYDAYDPAGPSYPGWDGGSAGGGGDQFALSRSDMRALALSVVAMQPVHAHLFVWALPTLALLFLSLAAFGAVSVPVGLLGAMAAVGAWFAVWSTSVMRANNPFQAWYGLVRIWYWRVLAGTLPGAVVLALAIRLLQAGLRRRRR